MCGVKIVIKTKTIGDTNYADYFRFKKIYLYISFRIWNCGYFMTIKNMN